MRYPRESRTRRGPTMDDPPVETWLIHDRINRYLLDAIPDEALGASLPKCRTVSDLLAHMHNVRLMWLKSAAAGGEVKGFKPHATAFPGHLIAHESHHRGQVGWTLKGTGRPLDQEPA